MLSEISLAEVGSRGTFDSACALTYIRYKERRSVAECLPEVRTVPACPGGNEASHRMQGLPESQNYRYIWRPKPVTSRIWTW